MSTEGILNYTDYVWHLSVRKTDVDSSVNSTSEKSRIVMKIDGLSKCRHHIDADITRGNGFVVMLQIRDQYEI